MDAPRFSRFRGITQLLICGLLVLAGAGSAQAASARTQNFLVSAATQELANEVARAAEKYRHDLAVEWLGHELPNWEQPCPITVKVSPRLGAGGATSFMFGGGKPYGWTMDIFGPQERVLDSVLPHEVTHTIFATHFGRPLPRWADEGACTTVEHASERGKQEKLLYRFLTTNKGIAFNKMFAMTEYPREMLPLYSQGYSLTRFLIALEGKRKFVAYVGDGMSSNNWTAATKKHYGFHSLSDLQLTWLEWVRKGTPKFADANDVAYFSANAELNGRTLAEVNGTARPAATAVALVSEPPQPAPESYADGNSAQGKGGIAAAVSPVKGDDKVRAAKANDVTPLPAGKRPPANALPISTSAAEPRPSGDGWYARRRDQARAGGSESVAMQPRAAGGPPPSEQFTSASRPQGPEQVRQTILEWKKEERALAPVGK
jgi:hypothetical protein